MLTWLRNYFWKRQREIDVRVLWPQLKKAAAGDMEGARLAFMMHAINDPAWVVYYGADLWKEVQALE